LDDDGFEIEVRKEHLGQGVRYVAAGRRVTLTLTWDGATLRLRDVKPV